MKLTVLVPAVNGCSVQRCGYNADGGCHARAITVGDGVHPKCDTYVEVTEHTSARSKAGVGACKVSGCRHNRDLECEAPFIQVTSHGDHADCSTFAL